MTSVRFLARMLLQHGFSPRYAPRIAWFAARSVMTIPARLVARCPTGRRVRQATIHHPPLFVIGHWRTGTTHLHNLLLCDPRFGRLSMFHCMAVHVFLSMPRLHRRLAELASLPEMRPMDAVRLSLDAPQEEELAMARFSRLSWNHGFSFPRRMRQIFERAVLFEGAPQLADEWKRDYHWLLRRLTIDQGGKPLCLKNPPNTARIRQLLELFPDARFVHIHRNPYVVYRSTLHMWERLLSHWALQPFDMRHVEENIVYFYRQLMQRYFEDVHLIPSGRLAEVRFEDLEADPIGEMARIYDELSLPGFAAAQPRIEFYLADLGDYRKNIHRFDNHTLKRVEDAWGFAIDRWGYGPPTGSAGVPIEQAMNSRKVKSCAFPN